MNGNTEIKLKKWDILAVMIIGEAVAWLFMPLAKNIKFDISRYIYYLPIIMPLLAAAGIYIFYLAGRIIRPVFYEIGKFGAIGVLNTLIDVGILNYLSYTFNVYHGRGIILFNAISFSVAIVNSYFWNKFWTFKAGEIKGAERQFVQFVFVSVIGIILNTVIVYALTTWIGPKFGVSAAVWENVAKGIGIPISLLWNFTGYKLWVFRRRPVVNNQPQM